MEASLPKSERICGKTAVAALFEHGKHAGAGCLHSRYILREDGECSRILVSLLKRRIRESYRRQKALLGPGVDILFVYTPKEVLPYDTIYADMTALLSSLSSARV